MSLARDVHYIKVRPGTEGIVMHHPQTILILWLLSHSLSVSLSSLYQFSSFALSRNGALKNQIIRPKSPYSQIETNQQKWGFPCGFVSNCLSPADFPLSGESEWTVMHVVQPIYECIHVYIYICTYILCTYAYRDNCWQISQTIKEMTTNDNQLEIAVKYLN